MIIRILVAGLLALAAAPKEAAAQDDSYPSRTVTVVVPVAPGGGSDTVSRLIATGLHVKWGRSVVVENRTGGGGVVGSSAVARAEPNGYTLLMTTNTILVNATLFKDFPFDVLQDLTPVALAVRFPFVLVINPSLPVKTVKELIEYANKQPGNLSFGSAGPGTAHHLSAVTLQLLTGLKLIHVPYRGSAPAVRDVVAGHIPLMFVDIVTALPLIKDGKVRALGVTEPSPLLPEIPTIANSGVPGFATSSWQAVMVTGRTPDNIVEKLNRDVSDVLASDQLKRQISPLGMVPVPQSNVGELRKFMRSEFDKFAKIVSQAGLAKSQ